MKIMMFRAALFLLLSGSFSLWANESDTTETPAKVYTSIPELLPDLDSQIVALDKELKAGTLDKAHEHVHGIQTTLESFQRLVEAIEEKKRRKRMKGYVKNLSNLAKAIHIQAEKNNLKRCLKFSGKMLAQWELVQKKAK